MGDRSRGRGWYDFAGAMFGIVGFFNAMQGLSAIFKKEYFSESALIYENLQVWGWAWLVIGVLQVIVAMSLFSGGGRMPAIILASLSTVVSFASIGAYPWWSILVIAFNVLVIFGLTTHPDVDVLGEIDARAPRQDTVQPPIR